MEKEWFPSWCGPYQQDPTGEFRTCFFLDSRPTIYWHCLTCFASPEKIENIKYTDRSFEATDTYAWNTFQITSHLTQDLFYPFSYLAKKNWQVNLPTFGKKHSNFKQIGSQSHLPKTKIPGDFWVVIWIPISYGNISYIYLMNLMDTTGSAPPIGSIRLSSNTDNTVDASEIR